MNSAPSEELQKELEEAEHLLETVKGKVRDIEARAARPMICIVASGVFLFAEVVYLILSKITTPKNKKEETEETAA